MKEFPREPSGFVQPVEKVIRPSVDTSNITNVFFRYRYVKVMEISNAAGIMLAAPVNGAGYQYLGNQGVLLSGGQIIMVNPVMEYEIITLPQFNTLLVLWNHPDLHWLQSMRVGEMAPIVRDQVEIIPAAGSIARFLYVDRRVCSVEFHYWFGPAAGGPYDLALSSITEEENYVMSGPAGPMTPIALYAAGGIAANSEHSQGLSKCSTVLPALVANILQSKVFGRWLRIDIQNTALMNPGELTQVRIKLSEG